MTTRLAAATGNFTTAGTWLAADATALNDVETTFTALTNAYQNSTAFTPGAITVDGIAIKIASRAAGSPANTITVRLGQAGVDVAGTPTTMNVSDIDPCSTAENEGGWYYFRFNVAGVPTPVLLLGATAYTVGVKLSATTTAVSLYVASGTNWTRMVVTTTTGAPAAGDRLAICADRISAGVSNNYIVTMDNTATTSFGSTVTQALTINKGGTLTFGTTAATAYYLKVKGITQVNSGGALNIGTSGTQMPSNSSAVLEFDATAAVDSGLFCKNGSTIAIWGKTITNTWSNLNTDEAVASTVWGIVSTADWANSDVVCIDSTTQTASQAEKRTISTVDSAVQITVTAGLTNAHSGTAPTQAYVGNLTRNVKIRGVSASLVGYVNFSPTCIAVVKYAEFTALGNFTSGKTGVVIQTTTGSITLQYCSMYDSTQATAIGIKVLGAATNNFTVSNNVVYNINATGVSVDATTGTTYTIDSNLVMATQSGGGSGAFSLSDLGGVITNNIGSSSASGSNWIIGASDTPGTFSGNIAHSGATHGFTFTGAIPSGTLSNLTAWRNGTSSSYGLNVTGACECIVDNYTCFGNASAGMNLSNGAGNITVNNSTFNAGVTLLQPAGIIFAGAGANLLCNSTTFGATTTHGTGDLNITAASTVHAAFNNCLFSSATEIANQTNLTPSAYIGSEKHDQTSGLNKTWRKYGILSIDTTIFRTSPSLRMTPNNASNKLEQLLPFKVAVKSGVIATVGAYVRESVVGDGTAYNGARIRLICKANFSLGVTVDTVIATATVASSGAFELISGALPSPSEDGCFDIITDCDGTTGWVNIDTYSSSPNQNTLDFQFWQNGAPVLNAGNNTATGFFFS